MRNLTQRLHQGLSSWRLLGLKAELTFWDRWLRTRGLDWPEDYRLRLDPDRPLSPEHQAFMDEVPGPDVHILDVGAGPLTVLGKRHPSKRLIITATDVLAPHYDRLLKRHHVQPPVRTIYAEAERLAEYFADAAFDWVHARNSIDHSRDPFLSIQQMLRVVKPGCCVYLSHLENEADHMRYHGLHQWNFTTEGTHFAIKGGGQTIDVTEALALTSEVSCTTRAGWITVVIRKRGPPLSG